MGPPGRKTTIITIRPTHIIIPITALITHTIILPGGGRTGEDIGDGDTPIIIVGVTTAEVIIVGAIMAAVGTVGAFIPVAVGTAEVITPAVGVAVAVAIIVVAEWAAVLVVVVSVAAAEWAAVAAIANLFFAFSLADAFRNRLFCPGCVR